ncbi:MAG: hypothetical protein NVS3B21_25700 [Acidimicrobiales bacterium]
MQTQLFVVRRGVVAVVACAILGLWAAPVGAQTTTAPTATAPETTTVPSGPSNNAIAVNTKNGSNLFKLAFSIRQISSGPVVPDNTAIAFASCTSCQTVAIAIQLVFVTAPSNYVAPTNAAVAVNYLCNLCQTFAAAVQYVVNVPGPVHFNDAGRELLKTIEDELRDLKKDPPPIAQIQTALAQVKLQIDQLIRTGLVTGGDPHGDQREAHGVETTTTQFAGRSAKTTTTLVGRPPTSTTTPTPTPPPHPAGPHRPPSPPHPHANHQPVVDADDQRTDDNCGAGHHLDTLDHCSPMNGRGARGYLFAAAAVLGVAACTAGGGSSSTPLGQQIRHLKPLHSGTLALSLTWSAGQNATAGFGVDGPFADPTGTGRLPIFSLTAHQIGGGAAATTITSDGQAAVAQAGRTVTPLPAPQLAALRGKAGEDLTGLRSLNVEHWAVGPQTATKDRTTGEQTVASAADPVPAINAIVSLANSSASPGSLQMIPPDQAQSVRAVLASSRLEVTTGSTDRLLHRIHLVLTFAPSSQNALQSAIGNAANVEMRFDATISQPNKPVAVKVPAG